MTSFQLSVTPRRAAAARYVENVRRGLQRAYAEAPNIKQTDIAREIGVHRSVINRQLRGYQDMGLSRVAEIAWALGYEPVFDLIPIYGSNGNTHQEIPALREREKPAFQTSIDSTQMQKRLDDARLETSST